MNDLQTLIKKGESEHLEFKVSFGKEAIEALCAFANTLGGTVLIGLSDKGKITGTQASQESIQKWINQIKNSTSPSIIPDAELFTHEDKTIVSLSVISYPIKPISFKGKYYKRVHNSNHLMDLNEIANEHLKTINLSWDFARDPNHGIPDISLEKVNQFIENSNRFRDYPINDDPLTVLKKTALPFGMIFFQKWKLAWILFANISANGSLSQENFKEMKFGNTHLKRSKQSVRFH